MRTVLNRIENQFSDFYILGYDWLYLQFTGDTPGFSTVSPTKKKVVQNDQIYRKYAQYAEMN